MNTRPERAALYLQLAADGNEDYLFYRLHSLSAFLAVQVKSLSLNLTVLDQAAKQNLYLTTLAFFCAALEEDPVELSRDVLLYNTTGGGWSFDRAGVAQFLDTADLGPELKNILLYITSTDYRTQAPHSTRVRAVYENFICIFLKSVLDQKEVNDLEDML